MELELRACNQQVPAQGVEKEHGNIMIMDQRHAQARPHPETIVLDDNHSQARTRSTTNAFNGRRTHRQTRPVIRSPVIN